MAGEGDAIDREALLAELGGDEELLAELVETMQAEMPKLLHEVRIALDAGDPALVGRAAHTLKGAVSNFGARPAVDAALALERMGREGELVAAAEAMERLELEMRRLSEALDAISA